ncbi:biliverdin-producing heme oxygenase [Pseudoblastomonas halimionae]|uniref:Heme oxygenase n=1 Tax=Alteriqipengyuania halimionae TaxID=1926630 RepID=A0A6I4U2W9_9SPHN|nr:biliverdin-producing heme oxygenase [Alteriqipengyuania halimionae]MXP08841.1 hypothetical protein [Alteriqipengyuania halimionae]
MDGDGIAELTSNLNEDDASLRKILRSETRDAHDRLDTAVTSLDLADPDSYRDFLTFQYAARLPVEQWLASQAEAPTLPPTTPLIAQDLAALGAPLPLTRMFGRSLDNGAIGVAWALAGSHLGNRAILHGLKNDSAFAGPTAFLADERMRDAWRDLLPHLEAPPHEAYAERAVYAASKVFVHFNEALDLLRDSGKSLAA